MKSKTQVKIKCMKTIKLYSVLKCGLKVQDYAFVFHDWY